MIVGITLCVLLLLAVLKMAHDHGYALGEADGFERGVKSARHFQGRVNF